MLATEGWLEDDGTYARCRALELPVPGETGSKEKFAFLGVHALFQTEEQGSQQAVGPADILRPPAGVDGEWQPLAGRRKGARRWEVSIATVGGGIERGGLFGRDGDGVLGEVGCLAGKEPGCVTSLISSHRSVTTLVTHPPVPSCPAHVLPKLLLISHLLSPL